MKDFITDINAQYTQVKNSKDVLKNDSMKLQDVLTKDAINKYGDLLNPILIYFVDKFKDNPKELKKISDFANNHKGALDKDTHKLVDDYLAEEKFKTSFWGKVFKLFGLSTTKAHTELNDSLANKTPASDLYFAISDKNDDIKPKTTEREYTPLQKAIVEAIISSKDMNSYDLKKLTRCIKAIEKSDMSKEEKISSLDEIKNIIQNGPLNQIQKNNSIPEFNKSIETLKKEGPQTQTHVEKIKNQEQTIEQKGAGRS